MVRIEVTFITRSNAGCFMQVSLTLWFVPDRLQNPEWMSGKTGHRL